MPDHLGGGGGGWGVWAGPHGPPWFLLHCIIVLLVILHPHIECKLYSILKTMSIVLFRSLDVEVGLEMGWLVQQNRQKQGLSQKDLAVVSVYFIQAGGLASLTPCLYLIIVSVTVATQLHVQQIKLGLELTALLLRAIDSSMY